MRRVLEQIIVDTAEFAFMLIEGLLFGIPTALHELAQAAEPYAYELIIIGGLVCLFML